ncbi:cytochrome c oxidase-assembly factor COX23, mitochondrial isoform X1 [Capsicum chacoense]
MANTKVQTAAYPSAARIADSDCYPQYTASLKFVSGCCSVCECVAGLEQFNSDKSKCQEHFDVYKECKKKEREARLERNRSRSLFS